MALGEGRFRAKQHVSHGLTLARIMASNFGLALPMVLFINHMEPKLPAPGHRLKKSLAFFAMGLEAAQPVQMLTIRTSSFNAWKNFNMPVRAAAR